MITIKEGEIKDAKILKDLRLKILQEFPDAFGDTHKGESEKSMEYWEKKLSEDSTVIFIAKQETLPIGMIKVGYYEKKNSPNIPYISSMGVLKEFQKIGVGKKLINACEKWARKNNSQKIRLYVLTSQTRATNFYTKQGFTIIKTEKENTHRDDGTKHDAHIMEKDLT